MEILIIALLAVGAIGAVLVPLMRGDRGSAAGEPPDLDAEVARYRAALRAGTVCPKCAEANPPGSRFCARCGRTLPEAA